MCVIIVLPPKTMLKKEHFVNAVHNNWHSWGIIFKDANGKLMTKKDCPKDGNDPEVIWKELEDNIDVERIVHLRHNTKGGTSMLNAQPFCVYKSSKREVWFMHNGTLYDFGSHANNEEAKSDTLDFCEKVVSPALLRWHGEGGAADYNDPEFKNLILNKRWNTNSRGLFVSNFSDNMYYGDSWKEYKQDDKDAPVIKISNDDYFARVTRGPFHEKMLEEERQRRLAEQERAAPWNHGGTGTSNKDTTFRIKEFSEADIKKSDEIIKILDDILDEENNAKMISMLSKIDFFEIVQFIDKNSSYFVATIITTIADCLHKTVQENEDLLDRNSRLHKAVMMLKRKEAEEKKAA